MGDVIQFSPTVIDMTRLSRPTRQLQVGLIQPAEQEIHSELAEEHKAEPIKSIEDIEKISSYLISEERYRDNMLFICGINFGLRISDLSRLTFSDLIDQNFCFKTTFPILERKTRNTRKVRKNRYITINDAVVDAVTLYLQNTKDVKLDDYMFRSESNRCTENKPMCRQSIDKILKGIKQELGLTIKMSSHSLRKTFGYHQMVMSGNDPRKLLLLQKIFGHSSAMQTLEYIGITNEEISEAYMNLNLGARNSYARFNTLEGDIA
jgi:Site-specific recombinase XerD